MRSGLAAVVVCALVAAAGADGPRYTFYRSMGDGGRRSGDGRRVFGGEPTTLHAYPAACALLDRYWSVRCSAAVVRPRWALTAAHCVASHVAYVKYNSRRPSSPDGDVAPVLYLYRHPGYRVQRVEDEGGADVALLHHDVGLVRTRTAMRLASAPVVDPLPALRLHDPADFRGEELHELFGVRLRATPCGRGTWVHCVCGVSAARGGRGVCSGDSGGPVLLHGEQVGVTSMGPVECGRARAGAGAAPPPGATSVFTALRPYAHLVSATINDTDASLAMRRLQRSGGACPRTPLRVLLLSSFVYSIHVNNH
ncbi:hypothetical protein K1T71_002910 [Dendrolimus kikuchii]|uniref:Uncharacterized protein n=1 Tax=Dendrolimus kikuchii TaxID=765133 RepID=A0ACC1DAD6_9NEOP|nr:hypothetical protein K1T71_002910 [Dendrolimus kikuchii]